MLSLRKKNNNKGFMLLEVILSVLIIASGLLFIIHSYSTSLKASELARKLAKASILLEEKLFNIDVEGFMGDGIKEGELSGIFEREENYSWYLNAQPLDDNESIKLNRVILSVNYKVDKVGSQIRKVGISTYLKYKEG